MTSGITYIGWIPNVAGRLSFSHIGASNFPTRCVWQNTGNAIGRRIAVAQKRRLADWLLPDFYFKVLYGFSATWRFVLVANSEADPTDQIARLKGEIFVLQESEWDRLFQTSNDELLTPKGVFEQITSNWARKRRNSRAKDELPGVLLQQLRSFSLFSFILCIRRSGVVGLKMNMSATGLAFADDYTDGERTPNSDDIAYIANQAFFFLKDISHIHRHHPPGTDTIVEVCEIDTRKTWAINTHYRIHRKVVEMRRSKSPKILYKTLGVLAYLSAMTKAVWPHTGAKGKPVAYNNAEIESSIKADLEVRKLDQTQRNIIKTALPVLCIAFINITGYDKDDFGGNIRYIINNYSHTHPRQLLAVGLSFLLTVPFYYGIVEVHDLPFVIRLKRILVASNQTIHGVIWIVISLCAFGIALAELMLAHFAALPTAFLLRSHLRIWSWLAALLPMMIVCFLSYFMPFWATRRDLTHAVATALSTRFQRAKHGNEFP